MKPLISVIIPVYNVEKYLDQCLSSVIEQSFNNIEILCINDCSTDSSLKILEKFSAKDPRIKIINNQQNLKAGLSRNIGIKEAKGEYIHFLDSDDWLEDNAYKKLAECINRNPNIDVIRFRYIQHNLPRKTSEEEVFPNRVCLNKITNIYKEPCCVQNWATNPWCKLHNTKFIQNNNLFFNDYCCMEDTQQALKVILKANEVYFLDDVLINYRLNREDSIMSKHLDNITYLIKDMHWLNSTVSELEQLTKIEILNYFYRIFIPYIFDAYYSNKINYSKLQETLEKAIDSEIIKEGFANDSKYLYQLYEYSKKSSAYKFFIKYKLKRFIKDHFPNYTNAYFKIKKRITKC